MSVKIIDVRIQKKICLYCIFIISAYKAYRDKYKWEEIKDMPMKVGTKHPQQVQNKIMREDAAIEAASSTKSITRGNNRIIITIVDYIKYIMVLY